MQKLRLTFLVAAALSAAACSVDKIPGVYRLDVQQGNVVTQETVNQLKPGMTQRQVRYLLGTPLIVDAFHPNRWDYYYSLRKGGRKAEQRHVALYFERDTLVRVEGDIYPGTATQNQPAASTAPVTMPEQRSKKGFFKRMRDKIGGDDEAGGASSTAPEPGADTTSESGLP